MKTPPIHLSHFAGGLHLPEHKDLSRQCAIEPLPTPERVFVPIQQHIGSPAEPVVKVGEQVLKGQKIAAPTGYVSAPVHAPTSGTVRAIGEMPVPHPSGLKALCIEIEADGQDRWVEHGGVEDFTTLSADELRERIRDAGIVGLGGATFPSHVKLNPPADKPIDTLVLNGAECEPYITCDDRLMRERPKEIIGGLLILRHLLGPQRCIIGIEDNKPEAYEALLSAVMDLEDHDDILVVPIPTLYPTGGEKQLIKVLTDREVPSGGLPADIGVVCHNVATAASIHRAVIHGEPLISRIVTVTGAGIRRPGNLEVPIGTPVSALIEHCGGYQGKVDRLIMGGPMMGFTIHDSALPILKGGNCILVAAEGELAPAEQALPCIRCARCADVCPAQLLPQQLYWYARAKDSDKVQDYNLFDCIECGCCAYVCPSHIPLVSFYRYAKTEIWAQEQEKKKADHARLRHEAKLARQEREKAEKAARMAKRKAELAKKKTKEATADKAGGADPKKAAIEAAMKRAQEKKARAGMTPKNTGNLTAGQQRQIEEAERRRAGGTQTTTDETN
jgi:electron transport complex protein RnfC